MNVSDEIAGGLHDSQLAEILRAAKFRKDTLDRQVLTELTPGDRIVITSCSPKLLIGKRATVQYVTGDKVQVKLPVIPGNYKWSEASVTVKPNMIERVCND